MNPFIVVLQTPLSAPSRIAVALKIVALLMLAGGTAQVSAEGWQDMAPVPARITDNGATVVFSLDGADATHPDIAWRTAPHLHRAAVAPSSGFMDNAFGNRPHSGKLGRIVDALGLQAIYREPLIRNVIERVKGSRLCLTDACGVNLKLSLRKPGLRFEHKF